ncbi:hypothetical protein KFZ76_01910 [Methylovulum psychrotolerans]|uniref:choice-of-anchor tandem repeat GloVer-containing protein n=1 Tax=Methylovulum psychrotolerans TaxID=1704499 RepID=UPI001BFF57B4|nr:choice-of-anchor tandem repeat GloVer-containing protein [Methylovulum psychrotolerans]MBT9096463.1 hypothetical protein [Methylovulum psychrotolerans]
MPTHHTLSSALRAFGRVAALPLLMALPGPVQAAQLTTLVDFDGNNGKRPYAGLTKDAAGNLYGTTLGGGANDVGTVFRLSPPLPGQTAWTPTLLADFDMTNGGLPVAELVRDAAGNLYGVTQWGGGPSPTSTSGWGTVFKLSPPAAGQTKWTLTTLIKFNNDNGGWPIAGLVRDTAGNLYGTTYLGGRYGQGTVFRVSPPQAGQTAWTLATLAYFNGKNGSSPAAGLVRDTAGNLYGTTMTGGTKSLGTVFRLSPPLSGQTHWTRTTLTNFNGNNGDTPDAKLLMDTVGNLYGTTSEYGSILGDTGKSGTVFRLSPPAAGQSRWALATLTHFDGTHGRIPSAGLVADVAGNLYGTTAQGGANDQGTVYKLAPPATGQTKWTLATLADFNGTDGSWSTSRLVRDTAGNLYGTTTAGGANNLGTVFKIAP